MNGLLQDLRCALRQFSKKPGFTVVAVLTLALGIGATAAMFSVVDAVVLRPLPYNDAQLIVDVQTSDASSWQPSSWPAYLEMRRLNKTFHALAGYADYWGMTLSTGNQAQYLRVTQASDNFFDVFGVQPLLGRTFLPGEDQPGKNDVVVLGYEVWQQVFNGDRDIVGKGVHLDGRPYVVVGVMPAGFRFPFRTPNLVYIPAHVRPNWVNARDTHWLLTVGRLNAEVTRQQAQADMAHVMHEIGAQYPDTDKVRAVELVPITAALHRTRNGGSELSQVSVLFGAVLAVLLIACANVAGLLLARGITREREMSLRVAIGAARSRLVRQLLVENAVLGIAGAGAGLLLAAGLLTVMKAFLAHAFMRGANIQLNLSVIAFTLVASVLSSIGAGLIPAWRAAKTAPGYVLKSGTTSGTAHRQHDLRASFVVAQIALSLILVVFSGLLLLTLRGMLQTDLGFNPQHVLTLGINIPSGDFKGRNWVTSLLEPLEQRVQAMPGAVAAGFNDQMPVVGYGSSTRLRIVGQPPDPPNRERSSESRTVTAGYFSAMGLPIVRGRNFTMQDTPTSQPVAIVNEAWVKEFLTEKQDPLAQAFQGDDHRNIAIVGVVKSVRQNLFDEGRPEIDFPFSQLSQQTQQNIGALSINFFVRTTVPPLNIVPQLRKALLEVAPTVAFQNPSTMTDVLDDTLVPNRMQSWLFGLFAGIAVLLAVIGIYGLLMQEVTSRTRDIGVRIALGATRATIMRTVLTRVMLLTGIGLGAGVLGATLLRRVVASVLVIQSERNGIVIGALVGLMALVGLLTGLIPARRAAKVDPMVALRYE
jgi:predicted permease